MTKSQNESCDGCKHYLGGGFDFCAVNLEDECAAGEFEAWEEKEGADDEQRGIDAACSAL